MQSSQALYLTSNNTYTSSQYGSIWFTRDSASTVNGESFSSLIAATCANNTPGLNYTSLDDCQNFQGVGYVVQYNFTGLHTSPTYQALADQAIARYATNDPTITIKATIAPLPITQIEKSFGQSEDAFLSWFLVSQSRSVPTHSSPIGIYLISFVFRFTDGFELSIHCRIFRCICESIFL